ncbi:MAG: hypothetical protein RR925_08280, partial [Erysipelotrichaceae bacterium]
NFLQISDLDFTYPITLEKSFEHVDPFCNTIGQYWESIINIDFEWHVFFVMLFAVQPGNNIQDFTQFIEIIKSLIIPPTWYREQFAKFGDIDGQIARDFLTTALAEAMVSVGKVDIVHEDKLIGILEVHLNTWYEYYDDFNQNLAEIKHNLEHKIVNLF